MPLDRRTILVIAMAVVSITGWSAAAAPGSNGATVQQDGAEITVVDQTSDGTTVTIDSVAVPEGGFVAVYEQSGTFLGVSEFLESGTHADVTVTVEEPLTADTELTARPHRDTNRNQEFDFLEGGAVQTDWAYRDDTTEVPRQPVEDTAEVSVEESEADALDRGLAGYWKFDEGEGNVAADSSDSGNEATIQGANWTDGEVGNALEFDAGDFVETSEVVDPSDGFTLSASFRTNETVDYQNDVKFPRIASTAPAGDWATSDGYQITMSKGSLIAAVGNGTDALVLRGPAVNDTTWHRVTLAWNGTHAWLTLDGEVVDRGRWTGQVTNDESLVIGATADERRSFVGVIDEVRLYDRALSPNETERLAKNRI